LGVLEGKMKRRGLLGGVIVMILVIREGSDVNAF
jgi:hypothetical protein